MLNSQKGGFKDKNEECDSKPALDEPFDSLFHVMISNSDKYLGVFVGFSQSNLYRPGGE